MGKPRGKVRASAKHGKRDSDSGIAGIAINRKLLDLIRHQEEIEEEITKSRDKFEDIFSKSPIGIELFSIDGDVLDANKACAELFGSDNADWKNYNILKDRRMPLQVRKALKRKKGIRFEITYPILKNGRLKNHVLDVNISVLRMEKNKPYAFLCQIQDITQRKETESQLQQTKENLENEVARRTNELTQTNALLRKELAWHKTTEKQLLAQKEILEAAERRYRTLFLMSPYPLYVIQDMKIVNGNSAALQLFGAESPKQLKGRNVLDFVHEDYREAVKKRLETTLEKGSSPSADIKILRLDGAVLDVESKRNLVTYKGKPAILSMMHDITEKKRSRALLEANDKLFTLHNESHGAKEYIENIAKQLKAWGNCSHSAIRLEGSFSGTSNNQGFPETYWKDLDGHETNVCACTLAKNGSLAAKTPDDCIEGAYVRNSKSTKRTGACAKGFGFGSMAIIPVFHQGKPMATIYLADANEDKFDRNKVVFLTHISEMIGNSLSEMAREADLRDKNELLEKFFGSMNVMVAYLDADLNYLRVNKSYASWDGHDPEYYVGKNHATLFKNKEQTAILKEVLRTGVPYSAYSKSFHVDGIADKDVIYWDLNIQMVERNEGEYGLLTSLQDVTERHRTEERLLDSYKHLGIINRKVAILLDLNKLHGGKQTGNIMQFIVNSALKLSQAKYVTFYEYKRDGDLLKLRCASGNGSSKHPEIIHANNCPMLKQLVKKKIRVQGAFSNADHSCHKETKSTGYHLFLPIIIRNQLKGCMHFEFSKRGFVTTQELDFYEAFTNNAASALEKIRLFRNPQQMKLDFDSDEIAATIRSEGNLSFNE